MQAFTFARNPAHITSSVSHDKEGFTPMCAHRPAPTLKDVASRAGVSTATVSRCLNTPLLVSDATRTKVMAAVEATGYAPNFGARAMATQRTKSIGVLVASLKDAGTARMLQGLETTLAARGYALVLATTEDRAPLEAQQIRALKARGVDALLLSTPPQDEETTRFLAAQTILTLIAGHAGPNATHPAIGINDRDAMAAMAEEVLRLGHRQIALVSADPTSDPRAAARQEGLRKAVRDAGLPTSAVHILTTSHGVRQGAGAFARLMDRSPRPSAVLCTDDTLAIGAMDRARAMGITVPAEVSVIGFGNLEGAQVTDPKLATVHIPFEKIGRKAARALLAALDDAGPIIAEEVAASLRLRASLGPVAKAR